MTNQFTRLFCAAALLLAFAAATILALRSQLAWAPPASQALVLWDADSVSAAASSEPERTAVSSNATVVNTGQLVDTRADDAYLLSEGLAAPGGSDTRRSVDKHLPEVGVAFASRFEQIPLEGSPDRPQHVLPPRTDVQPKAESESPAVRARSGTATSVCQGCCHDGEKRAACLDVEACAAEGPESGKYAFMLSFVGRSLKLPKDRDCTGWLPYIQAMRSEADRYSADILFVMPDNHSGILLPWHKDCMAQYKVKFAPVEWSTPPGMRYWSEGWNWHSQNGWCGPMDMVRLHALGFTQYDAVAYFDSDVEFQGDMLPVLRCAATGYMLNTIGPMSPINMGFLAVRPNFAWLQAVVNFAQAADFSKQTGWAGAMFKPDGAKYIGAECGQGFIHTLFYKKTPETQKAFEQAGLPDYSGVKAAMVDICVWNYINHAFCPRDMDCSVIRAHHKPLPWKLEPGQCAKLSVKHKEQKPGR